MNTLDCLIYVSTSKLTPSNSAEQIDDIVRISDIRNRDAGITGIITTQEGHFIQMLEGTPAAIDLLMLHLHFDSRHQDIVVVARERIANRDVVGWSMISTPQDATPHAELARLLTSRPDTIQPWRDVLMQMLSEPPRPSMTVQAA